MYRNTLFAFVILSLLITLAACNKKETTPCPSTPPPVSFLKFRLLDRNTGKDLLYDTTGGGPRFSVDSIVGTQPCRTDSLVTGYDLYQIPSAQPPYKHGYCFWFVNARNPALSESADCFNLYIWWNSHDVDTISWRYTIDESEPCQPQTIGDVYFNGSLVTPVWDNAYLYYPLLK
jgi:hypothetical protein